MKAFLRVLVFVLPVLLFTQCEWFGEDEHDPNDPVNIPDALFLKYIQILNDIDTNKDSIISYAEAEATTHLNLFHPMLFGEPPYINDLTGLEAFINLDSFRIGFHNIEHFDFSNNKSLKVITVFDCPIKNFNISNCSELVSLTVGNDSWFDDDLFPSKLKSLDISNNTALKEIRIGGNPNLNEVCVWTMPFPPEGIEVDTMNSPNINFTTDCSQ